MRSVEMLYTWDCGCGVICWATDCGDDPCQPGVDHIALEITYNLTSQKKEEWYSIEIVPYGTLVQYTTFGEAVTHLLSEEEC
jgi:hypothetical protein